MENPNGHNTITDDIVLDYLNQIGKYELLTADEEVELARTIERGHEAQQLLDDDETVLLEDVHQAATLAADEGESAKTRFIVSNLKLVVSVAKKYQATGARLQLIDLIQEGNLGLKRAVEKFDWRRGFKFSTYATWWIRQAISRAIAGQGSVIRIPIHAHEALYQVLGEVGDSGINSVTDADLEEMGIEHSLDVILSAKNAIEVGSLSMPVDKHGKDSDEIGDYISDEFAEAAYERVEETENAEEAYELLNALKNNGYTNAEKAVAVLVRRYGLWDGEPWTLKMIGDDLNLSKESVRQIENKALHYLREVSEAQDQAITE